MAAKFSSAAAARGATGSRSSPPRVSARLRSADFDTLYREGVRRASAHLLLLGRPRPQTVAPESGARLGVAVKSALGGAVVRNRIKRRMRALLTRVQARIPPGWDLVVQARSAEVARADFTALERELGELLAAVVKG